MGDEMRIVVERKKNVDRADAIGSVDTSPPINGLARSAVIVAASRKAAVTTILTMSVSAK